MSKNIYIGLAQWHHSKWYPNSSSSTQSLQLYSHSFSTVEGNSSFYAIPSENNIAVWNETTPDYFKFCFKFPKEISHKQCLTHCSRQVCEFLNRISVLNEKLGVIWLQLDQNFNAKSFDKLKLFLQDLPSDFTYGVEVRSLDFYRKDNIEREYNQLLMSHGINRVIFDTRSLFANFENPSSAVIDSATKEALKAKPKVPTHVINTASNPFVRIIVPMDIELGKKVIEQWVVKVTNWLDLGLTPYLFFHTPDNAKAPQFAQHFSQLLKKSVVDVKIISLWDQSSRQSDLF